MFFSDKFNPASIPTRIKAHAPALRQYYPEQINSIEKQFGPIDRLTSHYISPNGQNVNPADTSEDDTGLVSRSNLFTLMNTFLGGSPSYSHAIVLSDAGMGKTSLLVLLKLSYLSKLVDPSFKVELQKLGRESLSNIGAINDPSTTVLLLDALDEDPGAWENLHSRLRDLLNATKHFRKTVITCRTQFFPSEHEREGRVPGTMVLDGHRCSKLFLSPFDDGQVTKYIQTKFSSDADRIKAHDLVSRMKSLKFRPMLLSYLDLLIDSSAKIMNTLDLYKALVNEWIDREVIKDPKIDKLSIWKVCMAIALELFADKDRRLSKHEINLYTIEVPQISAITIEGRSLLQRTSEGIYKFAHYSMLEFFVACSIIAFPRAMRLSDQIKMFIGDAISDDGIRELSRVDLSGLVLRHANAERIDLRFTNLDNIQFSYCDMAQGLFSHSTLVNARFLDMSVRHSTFASANLNKSQFSQVNAVETNFSSARLDFAVFNSSLCQYSSFANTNCRSAEFLETDLSHADFSGADIRNANFTSAKMHGIIFSGTNFNQYTVFPNNFDVTQYLGLVFHNDPN